MFDDKGCEIKDESGNTVAYAERVGSLYRVQCAIDGHIANTGTVDHNSRVGSLYQMESAVGKQSANTGAAQNFLKAVSQLFSLFTSRLMIWWSS